MPQSATALRSSSTELTASMTTVITETIKLLVQFPDQVTVSKQTNATTVTFLVRVAPDDIDSVLGKSNRTLRSLRLMLKSLSRPSSVTFDLGIYAGRT
jgi:predicted RNA-binding protein YlqC (UPF0109 family)